MNVTGKLKSFSLYFQLDFIKKTDSPSRSLGDALD